MVASSEPGYPPYLKYISAAPPMLSVVGGENID